MVNPDINLYVFGPYTLNAREGILLRDGQRVPLQPKVFETLLILVKRHGHFVNKDELMQLIWPDTFVEEINLAKNISILRKTLANGDDSLEFIETLPKRGYRFVLPVQIIAEPEEAVKRVDAASLRQPESVPPQSAKRVNYRLAAMGVSLLLVAGLLAAYGWRREQKPAGPSNAVSNLRINRLTTSSQVFEAAISPDGQWLTYVLGESGHQSLRLKHIATERDIQLQPQFEGRYRGVNFSPDSQFIYFARREKNQSRNILYRLHRTGGESQSILEGVDSAIAFAPNGERFAFVREDPVSGESALIIAGKDGREERKLASRQSPQFYSVDGPAWSPDGKMVAVALGSDSDGFHYRVVLVRITDGQEKALGEHRWAWAMRVQWLSDGRGVVLAAREKNGTTYNQLWRLTYPDGEAHRVVADLHDYRNLSLTSDGKTMVTIQSEVRTNIWVAPLGPSGEAEAFKQITSAPTSQCGYNGLDWTPDGRLVYTAEVAGLYQLWIMRADGSQARQLTFNSVNNEDPSVSGDGRYIVYTSTQSGSMSIWRIDLDGSNPTKLTDGGIDLKPNCSPDGRWVVYSSERNGRRALWRIPIEGIDGPRPHQIIDKLTDYPVISPDGSVISCLYQDSAGAPRRIAVLPFDGGAPLQLFDLPLFIPRPAVRWHPSGMSLSFLDPNDNSTNVWYKPLSNAPPVRATNFDYERIFAYAWSRNGRHLAVSRGVINRDVVIIRGFD